MGKPTKRNFDGATILDLEMQENDSGERTIRGYLKALLSVLWEEEDGFSGKRPFGNSGWTWDVAPALVKAGFIKGKINDDGCDGIDDKELNDAMQAAIEAL